MPQLEPNLLTEELDQGSLTNGRRSWVVSTSRGSWVVGVGVDTCRG